MGRQDTILDGEEFANKFVDSLPNGSSQLQWIEECGHVPHLEQPEITASAIAEFIFKSAEEAKEKRSSEAATKDGDETAAGLFPPTEILAVGGLASIGFAILGSFVT